MSDFLSGLIKEGAQINPFTSQPLRPTFILGVRRLPEWGEFKVTVKVHDSYDEGKADYIPIDDKESVRGSLLASAKWAEGQGYIVGFTRSALRFLEG